jgi:hypothetical protein
MIFCTCTQVLFGPGTDGGLTVSAVGAGLFRCYKYAEQALKLQPASLGKRDAGHSYISHAWVVEGARVSGSTSHLHDSACLE